MADPAPQLLHGLSWTSLALVLAFCTVSALEVVTVPSRDPFYSDVGDMALSALARVPVFLVGAVTMLVTAIVFLNAAGRSGRERIGVAMVAAVLCSLVAAVMRYLVGATPAADGAAFILKVFIAWLIPALALAAGCVLYLRAHAARAEVNDSALRGAALEKQRQEARLQLLQAQIEPHFLFNTLSNIRRLCQSDVAAGRQMLAQLTRYLRAALPKFRVDEASLADEGHVARQRRLNAETRRWTVDELAGDGRRVIPSHANFLMVHLGRDVAAAIAAFRERKILVGRRFPSMPDWLRVSIGTPAEMRAFVGALREIVPVAAAA